MCDREDIAQKSKMLKKALLDTQEAGRWPPSVAKRKDLLLRCHVLRALPVEDVHADGVELLFSSPIAQEVIVNKVKQLLMQSCKPSLEEKDVANVALSLCFSHYLRAHAYWGDLSERR